MKQLLFIAFLFFSVHSIAYAQSATTACSGVTDTSLNPNLANDSSIANGFQECVEQYAACVGEFASGATCAPLARQYGQSKYNFTLWARANPNTDPSTNSDYRMVGTIATQLEEVIRAARVNNLSRQIENPVPPPPITNSDFQTPRPLNNGNLGYTPLEPIPGLAEAQSGNTNFALFLKYVFGVLISLGGLSAVVMLIFGGITYMVSDVVHKKTDALRRVQAAMWGLLLLIASWLILNAINPRLLVFELLINPVSNLSGNTPSNTLTPSTNNATTLNLSNTDPNRDATLGTFCRTSGSISRTPAADGLSTNYTCTPYVNNGSVMYP